MACGIIGAPRRVNYRGSRRATMSVRLGRWSQPVDATLALNLLLGFQFPTLYVAGR